MKLLTVTYSNVYLRQAKVGAKSNGSSTSRSQRQKT